MSETNENENFELTPSQIMKIASNLKRNFEAWCEIDAMNCKMMKARFNHLIESGFNEQQAISIIASRGVT